MRYAHELTRGCTRGLTAGRAVIKSYVLIAICRHGARHSSLRSDARAATCNVTLRLKRHIVGVDFLKRERVNTIWLITIIFKTTHALQFNFMGSVEYTVNI